MENSLETSKPGRPYGGVAHAERAAERREALLRAGTRLFGTNGFRRTTVRALCQEARLNDRYFYAAFDGTEALLRAVYQQHADRLRSAVVAAVEQAEDNLEARIDAGLDAFFELLRDTCAARVLLLEVMGVSAETDAVYQRNLREFGRLITALALPRAAQSDAARAEQRLVGIALNGALTHVGTACVLTGYRDPQARVVRTCREVLLGALRRLADAAGAGQD